MRPCLAGAQFNQFLKEIGFELFTVYEYKPGVPALDSAFVTPLVVTQLLNLFLKNLIPYWALQKKYKLEDSGWAPLAALETLGVSTRNLLAFGESKSSSSRALGLPDGGGGGGDDANWSGGEPLLHGNIAVRLFADVFMASSYGPRICRRQGFAPQRASVTWSDVHKRVSVVLDSARLKAYGGSPEGYAVRSAAPLPSTGRFFVDLAYEREGPVEVGRQLGGYYYTGVITGTASLDDVASLMSDDVACKAINSQFWGFEDCGETYAGVLHGYAPRDARNTEDTHPDDEHGACLFLNGDLLRLHFDREARTLTLHRNGNETSLVISGLPAAGGDDELHLLATPYNEDSHVCIICSDE